MAQVVRVTRAPNAPGRPGRRRINFTRSLISTTRETRWRETERTPPEPFTRPSVGHHNTLVHDRGALGTPPRSSPDTPSIYTGAIQNDAGAVHLHHHGFRWRVYPLSHTPPPHLALRETQRCETCKDSSSSKGSGSRRLLSREHPLDRGSVKRITSSNRQSSTSSDWETLYRRWRGEQRALAPSSSR